MAERVITVLEMEKRDEWECYRECFVAYENEIQAIADRLDWFSEFLNDDGIGFVEIAPNHWESFESDCKSISFNKKEKEFIKTINKLFDKQTFVRLDIY